ncbi:MAG: hypothetical protein DMG77_19520 [Acidobacteria bacterium]|nr:MAG: hypothetical protein DMG77_19520 [Acidobacteriota bacterium]
MNKPRARGFQLLLQACGAVTVAADPRFCAIFVAAFPAIVSVLNFREIEVPFPIRPLFLQRSGAVTDFHPADGLVSAQAGLLHVAQIFTFGNRALAEGSVLNGVKQFPFTAGFDASSN